MAIVAVPASPMPPWRRYDPSWRGTTSVLPPERAAVPDYAPEPTWLVGRTIRLIGSW